MGYGGKQASRSGDVRRFNFTGNGSNTAFDLGFTPATQNQLVVTINGLVQHYDAFSITGSTLTFTGTPAAGDSIQVAAVVDAVGIAGIPDGAVANVSSLKVTTTPVLIGNAVGTFTGPLIQAASSANSWIQINAQNLNNGNNASTDLVLARSDGNDTAGFIDVGINSNTYAQAGYSIMTPNSGYMFTNGGDLFIGTQTAHSIGFHTGNTTSASERMRIASDGTVGIGTAGVTGNARLNIRAPFSGSTATALGNVSTSHIHLGYPGYGDQYSQITFGYDGANAPAAIGAVADSASGQTSASLVFATRSSTASVLPTERMRINANGHVTMPSQPKWLYSGGTTIGTGWVTTKPTSAVISSANFDTGTGRFTAPVSGTYYVGVWGLFYPADSTDTWTAQFAKNGAGYGTNMGIQGGGNSTNHLNYSATTIIYLAAGDYVEFQVNTGSNGMNAYSTQWSQYGFLMG